MGLPSICLVAELPPPVGGMSIQAAWLTRLLRNEGLTIINVPTNSLAADSPWRRFPLLRGAANFFSYCSHLSRACSQADIVHVFSHSYLSFFLFTVPAAVWAKWLRKPLVLHYHGGAAEEFLKRWVHIVRPFFLSASHVIVPSSFLRDTFSRRGIETVEIPNVLAPNIPFRRRIPLQPNLIMTRHLEPVYNIACGLRAFRLVLDRYPGASLVVAGGGSERASLDRLTQALNLGGHVRFTGPISSQEIFDLYDQADIFLNSSNVDNQPVSILEAFASGIPVVSTAAGGIPLLVRDGEDALLAPVGSSADLARQVIRLLNSPELAERLIENGLLRSRAFSGAEIYRQLSAVYREVMTK